MALENISNVPQVLLRIAPRALHIQIFLGGRPPKPPARTFPLRRLRRLCAYVSVSHRTPPGKKSWIRPCRVKFWNESVFWPLPMDFAYSISHFLEHFMSPARGHPWLSDYMFEWYGCLCDRGVCI